MLKVIFTEYRYSYTKVIDISDLRKNLAVKFQRTGEFDINYPADSIEALLAILKLVHYDYVNIETENFTNQKCIPMCPSHLVFPLLIKDILICMCGAVKEQDWDYCSFFHTFYVSQIFESVQGNPEKLVMADSENIYNYIEESSVASCLGRLCDFVKAQWDVVLPICPNEGPKCVRESHKILQLEKTPEVFGMYLIWENSRPSLLNLLQTYASIPYTLNINQVYNTENSQYFSLDSMILYGSGHYISLINKGKSWFKVNDESVLQLGDWAKVVLFILESRYFPVGLFYTKSGGYEDFEIALAPWIELEIDVIKTSQFRDIQKSPSGWVCSCGNFNSKMYEVCECCKALKPGTSGWVCQFCTSINEESLNKCQACDTSKLAPLKNSMNKNPLLKSYNLIIKNSNSANEPHNTQTLVPRTQEKLVKNQEIYSGNIQNMGKNEGQLIRSQEYVMKKCKCCQKFIKENKKMCMACYLTSNEELCQFCGKKTCNEFCAVCIRSSIKCEDCSELYHVMDYCENCKSKTYKNY